MIAMLPGAQLSDHQPAVNWVGGQIHRDATKLRSVVERKTKSIVRRIGDHPYTLSAAALEQHPSIPHTASRTAQNTFPSRRHTILCKEEGPAYQDVRDVYARAENHRDLKRYERCSVQCAADETTQTQGAALRMQMQGQSTAGAGSDQRHHQLLLLLLLLYLSAFISLPFT